MAANLKSFFLSVVQTQLKNYEDNSTAYMMAVTLWNAMKPLLEKADFSFYNFDIYTFFRQTSGIVLSTICTLVSTRIDDFASRYISNLYFNAPRKLHEKFVFCTLFVFFRIVFSLVTKRATLLPPPPPPPPPSPSTPALDQSRFNEFHTPISDTSSETNLATPNNLESYRLRHFTYSESLV